MNLYFCATNLQIMTHLERIKHPITEELDRYKALFDRTLFHSDALLGNALEHIRRRSGKMMRPMLVLLSAKAAGRVEEATLHAAVAVELLHTASLVHDDVVDESDERRGQASTNALYGSKVAVLVGDYLLSTVLAEAGATRDLRIIERITGLGRSLAEGEIDQLTNIRNEAVSEEAYYRIIGRKTGTLFATSAELGALSAGAEGDAMERMRTFGELVGACFQIRDDIFDYISDASVIGKPVGNDMLEGKLTLPVIYALRETADAAMMELAQRVKKRCVTQEEISRLVDFTVQNGGIAYAERQMELYRSRGRELLAALPPSDVRTALSEYMDFVIDREQ